MMTDDDTPTDSLDIPTDATPAEAAAIAAAIGAHLRDERAAARAAAADTDRSWDGDRFRFAGRLDGLTGRTARVPSGAPRDEWTAVGRRGRYDR